MKTAFTKDEILNFDVVTRQAVGMHIWSQDEADELWLFPKTMYYNLPLGLQVESLLGDQIIVADFYWCENSPTHIDDDTRGGMLAYGVRYPKSGTPSAAFIELCFKNARAYRKHWKSRVTDEDRREFINSLGLPLNVFDYTQAWESVFYDVPQVLERVNLHKQILAKAANDK